MTYKDLCDPACLAYAVSHPYRPSTASSYNFLSCQALEPLRMLLPHLLQVYTAHLLHHSISNPVSPCQKGPPSVSPCQRYSFQVYLNSQHLITNLLSSPRIGVSAPQEQGFLLYLIPHSQPLKPSLAHRKCSVNADRTRPVYSCYLSDVLLRDRHLSMLTVLLHGTVPNT